MKGKISSSILALLCAGILTSCIKDELQNTECDILSAWVEGEEYATNFYQANQMRQENIPSNDKQLVFTVRSLLALPQQVPVCFTLTPGATILPANGSMQDFTAGPVTYTVTSEDGAWQRQYQVEFREASLPKYKFDFEHVDTQAGNNDCLFHVFYEEDQAGKRHNIWASGNEGVTLIHGGMTPTEFPTFSTDNGYQGKGVCLNTQYAGDLGKIFQKPIAAGNLYLGKFNVNNVLFEPLKTTEFGTPIDREPVRVTGYYKYSPGKEFTNALMEVDPNRTDEAHIYAVFYRNQDANGNSISLFGDDVLSSPYIVKKAQVAALPPTDKWTRFEMFFEGDDADDTILQNLGYNMTLVFSSSKNGASFEGAIGSTLYVDEVEVFFKEEEKE